MLRPAIVLGCIFAAVPLLVHGQDHLRRNSGQPYLAADETARQFRVPDGFEVKVVAAEPEVINPIAFCFDERGRMWVVESFEYPKGAPPGAKPRDRVKILEDRDGDGRAEKVTLFADGLNLATGIAVGHGGVFVGAAPDLLFLRDTDGDDRADSREVLLTGFGRQDTHELLNTFTWGPDGWLYGCHGVFTYSKVQRPGADANAAPIEMNAAVWRYHPATRKFEVFAEGTSNPWGIDFDSRGNMFLTCCVIPHMFHMIPGGRYIRQAGQNRNPYDFGQLAQISDHLHHEESGWAHAGCVVLEGDLWPEPLRGSVIFGSIHGNSIKRDVLAKNGSTFVASHAPDFLQSGDKNFRPVNQLIGPDGAIYIIDWCDQWPCHQTPPDLWDKKYGRIFKVQRQGAKPTAPADLAKLGDAQLVEALRSPNPHIYRTVIRLLNERGSKQVAGPLREMLAGGSEPDQLRALWGLAAIKALDPKRDTDLLKHPNESVRSWMVRFAAESHTDLDRDLAKGDSSAAVRLALAAACQRLDKEVAWRILTSLAEHPENVGDPAIPLMIWFALEPLVVDQRQRALDWLEQSGDQELVRRELVPRTTRRLVASGNPDELDACLKFAASLANPAVQLAALQGIASGLEGRRMDATPSWTIVKQKLSETADPAVRGSLRRIGAYFRDRQAVQDAAAVAEDSKRSPADRSDAVRSLAIARLPDSLPTLQKLLADDSPDLRRDVLRALGAYDSAEIPQLVIQQWKSLSDPLRSEAQTLLTGRRDWAHALLDAMQRGDLDQSALSAPAAQRIAAIKDEKLTAKLEKTWGSVRQQTPAEIDELIKRMRRVVAANDGDPKAGKLVFEKKCAVCHKFDGQGADVGPDITGADRSVDYLLVNVLDPNRVVGQPYYTHVVATKSGRVISGRLISDAPAAITLQGENNKLDVIPRGDIEEYAVKNVSVMPEGLPKDMTDEQFRDLIHYLRRR